MEQKGHHGYLLKNHQEPNKVHTISRNMNPTLHAERCSARATLYQKEYGKQSDVLYTDAATYATRVTASLRTSNSIIGEELAIAMATGLGEDHVTIMRDPQAAQRRFQAGRVLPKSLKILTKKDRKGFSTVDHLMDPKTRRGPSMHPPGRCRRRGATRAKLKLHSYAKQVLGNQGLPPRPEARIASATQNSQQRRR
ncbi:hypothetical protein HPB47_003095, partial [Ixodes persulcatus]